MIQKEKPYVQETKEKRDVFWNGANEPTSLNSTPGPAGIMEEVVELNHGFYSANIYKERQQKFYTNKVST